MAYDVRGAIDLHVHCGPEAIPRKFDAIQMARHVSEAGLGSVVMKSHFADTSSWAQMAHRETGVRLHGSITLNHYVGGINPMAVRGALGPQDRHGSYLKVVWLPTVHADSHLCVHCRAGDKYDIPAEWAGGTLSVAARPISELARISMLAPEVQNDIQELIAIIADNDLVLATGHVGRDEIYHVFDLALKRNISKFIVTHAQYNPPGLPLEDMQELGRSGAFIEFCYVLTDLGLVPIEQAAEAFSAVGPERAILSTDVGQINRVPPGEALTEFGTRLQAQGVPSAEIDVAMKHNPRMLLGEGRAVSG